MNNKLLVLNAKILPVTSGLYRSIKVAEKETGKWLSRWLTFLIVVAVIILFLPWTQNIQSRGTVTALNPGERPQTIHSTIAGRIEKWYVNEGQFVKEGDTIVFISEIRDAYFDPQLIKRAELQISAKTEAMKSYIEKVNALDNQIKALQDNMELKLRQAENKLR